MFTKKFSLLLSIILLATFTSTAYAKKSVYAITDHGWRPGGSSAPAKIAAYGIDGDQITLQEIFTPDPNFYQTGASHGPIDLAVDSDSAHLFVTYEGDNFGVVGVEVVNAKSMTEVDYVPAPGASDLAGIVFDEGKQKLYTVGRGTDRLFVYTWNPATKTLNLDGGTYKTLTNLGSDGACGLALDEIEDMLYVTKISISGHKPVSNTVYYYDTNDFSYQDAIDITVGSNNRNAVGVAVYNDGQGTKYLYTGTYSFDLLDPGHQYLVRTDLNDPNDPNSFIEKDIGASATDISVDPDTGLVYVTTSNNRVAVYDTSGWPSDPNQTVEPEDYETDYISGPAGICVPTGDVSYKPPLLVLTKDDNDVSCVVPGDYITYTISYDANGHSVNDVNIIDYLPSEVQYLSSDPCGTYNPDNHTVTWNVGTLEPNESNSVALTVTVNDCILGCGTITNFCEAESDSTYNTTEANTPVCSASNPEPTCGAIVVDVGEFNLTWCPGLFAADVDGHEVYLGSNFNDVNDADINDVNVYKGTVTNPCYTLRFNTLDLHTTYYWRIDEVNDPNVWRGGVWSFTTGNYFVVDDFDSYARDEDLQDVWNDWNDNGSRAEVSRETSIAHDGNSMRYLYDNYSAPHYAEADAYTTGPDSLPSQIGSDWTAGASALVLYFYGQSGNDANEQMYVRLHDADSNAVVTYGDCGEGPNDLRVEEWQEWNIDLEDFNSAGVDLTNVTRITIGFGDKAAPDGDGEGTVYFDDIRLYIYCLSRQAPEYDDWLAWGTPDCWCYQRQCRGDVDGLIEYNTYWVFANDLNLFKISYGRTVAQLPPNGICCDLDHQIEYGTYRVFANDLAIFKLYYGKNQNQVPKCNQPLIYTGPYNFWIDPNQPGEGKSAAEPVDIEALIKWLEELWLTDEQVRERYSEAEWLEFIETARETSIY